MRRSFPLAALLLTLSSFCPALAQHQMENLGRGLVAVSTGGANVFLSWRMLGTDPANVAFNVYRGTTKLNATPITNVTSYIDTAGGTGQTYSVRPVIGGVEQGTYNTVTGNVWGQQYLQLTLQRPAGGTTPDSVAYTYAPNDCSVGDVDGDGEYEIFVKWYPSNAQDNANAGYTGNCLLDCYRLNGTRLWRIDLGINIRSGAHYTQFQVYDYDGDGRAEMMCKTAPGSRDSSGAYLSMGPAASDTDTSDYRNSSGYVLSGPEYLTVFNGSTGREMSTINYNPPRGTVSSWGDNYGNRVDRFLAGTAYLDGQRPTAVFCRGYYTRTTLWAVDWRGGTLTQRWFFDTNTAGTQYAGKGNHQLSIGDVDNDGRDEIIYGALTLNDNGTVMYAATWGHADALHVADISPTNPGLEIWDPNESANGTATGPTCSLRDARTGAVLWYKTGSGDIGRAMSSDITAAHAGMECWASGGNGIFNAQGTAIGSVNVPINFAAWWDGDLLREMMDGITISKYNVGALLTASGATSINGTKANPCLSGDILGDWREEVIWPMTDGQNIRIYTTTNSTNYRFYTLMHDSQYRVAVAWQNTAYNQPPHPSFFLGDGMTYPVPQPNITVPGGVNTPTRTHTPNGPTATFTRTLTASPTATATLTPVGYQEIQLENACVIDGVQESTNAGYTGTGYANPDNAIGTTVQFSLLSNGAQALTLTFRYANGSANARNMSLSVNGVQQVASVTFSSTGDFVTWQTVNAVVNLSNGYNLLSLTALIAEGGPNLDRVSWASSTVANGNCAPPLTSTSTRTATASLTRTSSPTSTLTSTRTATSSSTPTSVPPTATASRTATPSASMTSTSTPSSTSTRTSTQVPPTLTASSTSSRTPTVTNTVTVTPSSTSTSVPPTSTPTSTGTSTASRTWTSSATATRTSTAVPPTATPTSSLTSSATATLTSTRTATASSTATASFTWSATPTTTLTSTPSVTLTPTGTLPPTQTATLSFTPTVTLTLTASATPSSTATLSATPTSTTTFSTTPTRTATMTLSATSSATSTASLTASPTVTVSMTATSSPTGTLPPTATLTLSSTPTASTTSTATATATSTRTLSSTATATTTATSSSTSTLTRTSTQTSTPSPTSTLISTPTLSRTATPTLSVTSSATSTASLTMTRTATSTTSATASMTPTFTWTATPTPSATVSPTVTVTSSPTMTAGTHPVVFPNPVSTGTVALLPQSYAGSQDVIVCIYTAGYKLAGTKRFALVPSGQLVNVELVDDWGQTLADGVYYLTVTIGRDRKTTTLVLAR